MHPSFFSFNLTVVDEASYASCGARKEPGNEHAGVENRLRPFPGDLSLSDNFGGLLAFN
jgi:hypothetical protein